MVWARMGPKVNGWLPHLRVILMVNQFHLHYAKNIIPSQEAIQISGIQKEEESTHQNLKKKKQLRPQIIRFSIKHDKHI